MIDRDASGKFAKGRESETLTHGMSRRGGWAPEYRVWAGMIQRCTNPSRRNYASYGGRGISVCDRWFSFENFYEDMGTRPDGASIDRIDVNGDYEPSNCRWLLSGLQARNKTNNKLDETKAEAIRADTRPRKVIAEEYGVSKTMIHYIKTGKQWT